MVAACRGTPEVSAWLLVDHRALQPLVLGRVEDVEAAGDDTDRARRQTALVRRRVDPAAGSRALRQEGGHGDGETPVDELALASDEQEKKMVGSAIRTDLINRENALVVDLRARSAPVGGHHGAAHRLTPHPPAPAGLPEYTYPRLHRNPASSFDASHFRR